MSKPLSRGEAVQIACIWEATARKVGNVHPRAEFADTSYLDFLMSAALIAGSFNSGPERGLGAAILDAVRATTLRIGKNTNLGMILLFAPLCKVSEEQDLRAGVVRVLSELTIADASLAFNAIRLARPGGLGETKEQDVRQEPTVTLLEAMRLAAGRDQVARQYASGFADIFDFGLPVLEDALRRFGCLEAAIIDLQLRWLARESDSLIARKNGMIVANDVQKQAAEVLSAGGIETNEGRRAGRQLDAFLRKEGNRLNPGSTADLIAACLFVALRENRVTPSAPFAWMVEDWL